MLVAEDDPRAHGAPRLLAIDEDVIAIHGHLGQTRVRSQPICMLMVTWVAQDLNMSGDIRHGMDAAVGAAVHHVAFQG